MAKKTDVVTAVLVGRVGDTLVAGPMLRALRKRYPEARLRLIAAAQSKGAAELLPWLDERLYLHRVSKLRENVVLAFNLLKGGNDVVVDLNPAPSRTSTAIVAALRAPLKLGFEKERFNAFFTKLVGKPKEDEHMLDRYARMAAALEAPWDPTLEAQPSAEDERAGEELAAAAFNGSGPRLIVHAGNFKKFDNRWPEDRFIALGRALNERGCQLTWLAGPGEREPVAAIAENAGGGALVTPPSLGATAALMKRCDLVVCNITGTTHLAAAVGAPTFGLYAGYTNAVWRPRGERHRGAVSKDWRSCRDIPVEAVVGGILERLPGSCST